MNALATGPSEIWLVRLILYEKCHLLLTSQHPRNQATRFLALSHCLRVDSQTLVSQPTMDQVMAIVEPGKQFAKDSIRLLKRCTKPDRKGKLQFHFISAATSPTHLTSNLPYI